LSVAEWLNADKPLLLKDLKGKVVLLELWATWCPPCQMAESHPNALHTKFGKKGLVIIGMGREDADVLGLAAKEHKLAYPLAADADKTTFTAYDIHTLPASYLMGPDGKVV
jgi:peroxiredoxin